MDKRGRMLAEIDPSRGIGLEIGPLDSPIVTREMGNVRYVDHASTEELKVKNRGNRFVNLDRIVDVDFVWGARTLPELVGAEGPFDYVIASHVIEHVPDLVGWLNEVRAILRPQGILSLAIPDKRYCFDHYRPPTTVADALEAYAA
jgi:SAM-dependent methyltransferase